LFLGTPPHYQLIRKKPPTKIFKILKTFMGMGE